MKLYEIDFDGVWPVGNCLIILAEDEEAARAIAYRTIEHTGLNSIREVPMDKPKVVVYLSGDY